MATEINNIRGISTRQLPMTDRAARALAIEGRIIQNIGKDDAKSVLTTLRGKLENGGRPRSGYLKLMHTTKEGSAMAFETKTKNWWNFWRAGQTTRTAETGAALKALFERAGLETGGLERYLGGLNGRKISNKEVLRLLQTAEQNAGPQLSAVSDQGRPSSVAEDGQLIGNQQPEHHAPGQEQLNHGENPGGIIEVEGGDLLGQIADVEKKDAKPESNRRQTFGEEGLAPNHLKPGENDHEYRISFGFEGGEFEVQQFNELDHEQARKEAQDQAQKIQDDQNRKEAEENQRIAEREQAEIANLRAQEAARQEQYARLQQEADAAKEIERISSLLETFSSDNVEGRKKFEAAFKTFLDIALELDGIRELDSELIGKLDDIETPEQKTEYLKFQVMNRGQQLMESIGERMTRHDELKKLYSKVSNAAEGATGLGALTRLNTVVKLLSDEDVLKDIISIGKKDLSRDAKQKALRDLGIDMENPFSTR
jgi:hypothetical protein